MRISDWSSDVCSSDLQHLAAAGADGRGADVGAAGAVNIAHRRATAGLALAIGPAFGPTPHRVEDVEQIPALRGQPIFVTRRSEEHTSELQSLMRISYAVFCLKKKKKTVQ